MRSRPSREPVAEKVTMTARTVQQAPSQTALAAAFYRAMAHRDATVEGIGSDRLAWTFLPTAHRLLVRFGCPVVHCMR